MNKKFFSLCYYLDYKKFETATEEELKKSLQDVCDYFSYVQGRKKIKIDFNTDNSDIYFCLGEAFVDEITINIHGSLKEFSAYINAFDCVIHESFHQFQYYMLNLPQNFVDDVMWKRIISYNIYNKVGKSFDKYNFYRFNDFELDAYRFTDFMMRTIKNSLNKNGADTKELSLYLQKERKYFLKDVRKLNASKENKKVIDYFYKSCFIYELKNNPDFNELKNLSEQEVFAKIKNGCGLCSILDDSAIVDVPQKFIDNANRLFKEYLPHLYSKTKPIVDNDIFLEK